MIQVILGSKGSGKTKRLIDITNDALKSEHGNVVFIDDDKRYMYDLRHEIRFVDASEYPAGGKGTPEAFLAFICGMLAVNYDITMICIDAFKKLVRADLNDTKAFFDGIARLSEEHHCKFVISISAPEEEVPDFIRAYAV